MYFIALASDYDGTLATDGRVDADTLAALDRLKQDGRKLILVTGRELPDLKQVFPRLELFDRVVAENGALLYVPATREERVIAAAPPHALIDRLRAANVPFSIGHSILATWKPHETAVLGAIRELGLEWQITFNKGAVMVLPPGINKASGLAQALADLGLSRHNVVGVGDAENDHAFLAACGCGVAVANALPMLQADADFVTEGERGAGVQELVARLLAEDAAIAPLRRHAVDLGRDAAGETVYLSTNEPGVLIAGSSGIGKSTLATALLERMTAQGFQFCIFDPEGDYQELQGATIVGNAHAAPQLREIVDLLKRPDMNLVINALGVDVHQRPSFFAEILPEISKLRAATGRPHWLVIDEAHHLLPAARSAPPLMLPTELPATILVTVHPDAVSSNALEAIGHVVALGDRANDVLASFQKALDLPTAQPGPIPGPSQVLFWSREKGGPPTSLTVEGPKQARKRHTRKYAEGDLGDDASFYFRGADGRLNLKAQNLQLFLQIADGLDDATWEHHRRLGDYSQWFRTRIKDPGLADEAAAIEVDGCDAQESRRRVRDAVARRYTAPAHE
jgi:hydroxymethylpyrimidine pyrophosphatase-like HAD family hydrolase